MVLLQDGRDTNGPTRASLRTIQELYTPARGDLLSRRPTPNTLPIEYSFSSARIHLILVVSVARHRRDNGLYSIDYWHFIRTIQLPSPPPTNTPNLAASASRAEANVSEGTALPTATPATPPHTR